MTTARQQFEDRLTALGLTTNILFNGRAGITFRDGIHLFECPPEKTGINPTETIYPSFNELRKDKQFFLAAVRDFADRNVYFLGRICKWFASKDKNCPFEEMDLFYIDGNFAKSVIEFKDKDENTTGKLSRGQLIQSVTDKYGQGYVLDGNKMNTDHISYVRGMSDTIKKGELPCLVKNPDGDIAVAYFEEYDPIPLQQQIHLKGSGWLLEDVATSSLRDILDAMVVP